MKESEPKTLKDVSAAFKAKKAISKERYKVREVEWKEKRSASRKVAAGMFDPNKYSLWI